MAPNPPERRRSMLAFQEALDGHYVLQRQLGRGGMGVVYLAWETPLERLVALKVLPPALATAGRRERFLKEARIAAGLRHDHIVPIYAVGEAGPYVYYAMEYIDGMTLSKYSAQRRQVPLELALRIGGQVMSALHKVHCADIIHRDLKPGNVMIDSLVWFQETARKLSVLSDYDLAAGSYTLVTMHRPSNVDDFHRLAMIVDTLERIGNIIPVIFPAHPRTIARLKSAGLHDRLASAHGVHLSEPRGYLEFLHLMDKAAVVLTDSGGIQEETTYLGIPCLTVRENTERPVTIEIGTNRLVPLSPDRIVELVLGADELRRDATVPPLWDGSAAFRIADALQTHIPAETNVRSWEQKL